MNTSSLSFAKFVAKLIQAINLLGVIIIPTVCLGIAKLMNVPENKSGLIIGISAGITLFLGVGTGIGFYQFWSDNNEPVARKVRTSAFVSGMIGATIAVAYAVIA